MASQYETCIALLKSTALVDLTTGVETTLYPVPEGKKCIVTHVIVHTPSASLASVSDVKFGSNAGTRNDWDASARTLALITGTTLAQILTPTLPGDSADQVCTVITEAGTFGVKVAAGAAVTATFDVFGYLIDV